VRDDAQELPPEAESERHVLFRVGRALCALPMHEVRQVLATAPITLVPRLPEFVLGVTNLRGRILAVVDLARRLGLDASESSKSRVIVAQHEEVMLGYRVAQVLGTIDYLPEDVIHTPQVAGGVSAEYLRGVVQDSRSNQADAPWREIVMLLDLQAMISADISVLTRSGSLRAAIRLP
jgi:purine-binding chemotaxis protein CheW